MRPEESFVEQPVRSLQTMLRVIAEDDGRLPTVVPDGIYGPTTMNAVTAFQRREGLPITGIADQHTWERVTQAYEPALIRIDKAEPIEIIMDPGQIFHRGEASPYIYLLQAILTHLSENHPQIIATDLSGILDQKTSTSLLEFQKLAGLIQTGELDKITWKHLVRQFSLSAHHNTVRNAQQNPYDNSTDSNYNC